MNKTVLSRLGVVAIMLGLIGGGYLFLKFDHRARPGSAVAAAPAAIPVATARAESRDMPLIVRGIGTVQAYNLVDVKSRVDGTIVSVDFREGQEVKAGDRLFQIDPRPYQAALARAQASRDRNSAQFTGAHKDLERYRILSAEGYQSRQTLDEQIASVDALRSSLAADEAAIDSARLNLDYADIRAPIDGRTGTRQVDIGNLVRAEQGTSLVVITQVKPIFVTFTVPQHINDEVRRAQDKAPLAVIAYAADPQIELARGELSVVDNRIEQATGMIRLKATFANADERLWPGQFVNVRLLLANRPGMVTIPQRALMQSAGGYFAYVATPDGRAERRVVDIAGTQDGLAIIERGLSAGETVVVDGLYRLTGGARIKPEGARSP